MTEILVVDASVSASWLFDDEDDQEADAALAALETAEGIVPQLWHYEMRNILLVARRRQRISAVASLIGSQPLPSCHWSPTPTPISTRQWRSPSDTNSPSTTRFIWSSPTATAPR